MEETEDDHDSNSSAATLGPPTQGDRPPQSLLQLLHGCSGEQAPAAPPPTPTCMSTSDTHITEDAVYCRRASRPYDADTVARDELRDVNNPGSEIG